MNRVRVVIGLTGVFGSGKTTVSHLFRELGATVIDADLIAHEALWKGSPVYEELTALFPEATKDQKGLDRKSIAQIVFKDAKRREELEKRVHPYVRTRMEEEVADSEGIVILEVPLLFEAGFDWFCDATLTVEAPEDVMLKRLQDKGWKADEVRARWKAQMPLSEKIKRSDYEIHNAGDLEETKKEVKAIWQKLHLKINHQ
jgi:dephospho-CoA kinase